jgi:hypothetical protein
MPSRWKTAADLRGDALLRSLVVSFLPADLQKHVPRHDDGHRYGEGGAVRELRRKASNAVTTACITLSDALFPKFTWGGAEEEEE